MLTENQRQTLLKLLPNKILHSVDDLNQYRKNPFYAGKNLMDAVCLPAAENDVITIVQFCIDQQIPLVAFGDGTGLEGHTAMTEGGICVDMRHMKQIKELNRQDNFVIVEPGISYNDLNIYLNPFSFHFPVEAGFGATIGGMSATNASGSGALDAGSMAKNVMGLRAVVYQDKKARAIKTGSITTKTSAGYNLTNLFVGSEGTLGIFTEVTLRIRKNFAFTKTVSCQFDTLNAAMSFIIAIKNEVHLRKAELLDPLQTKACCAYSDINFLNPDQYTILIELAGNEASVNNEIALIRAHHNETLKVYATAAEANALWMMRKMAGYAAIQFIGKEKKAMATDACVPLSALENCIAACYQHMQRIGLIAPLMSHVGDGNFHFTIVFDPNDAMELQKAHALNKSVVEEALKYSGTCSGEHGIGLGKKDYLRIEHGDSLFLMRAIKKAFDPLNIFNPDKVLDMS